MEKQHRAPLHDAVLTPSGRLDPRNDLPPARAIPILHCLANLSLEQFRGEYALETKTDERGFVDYGQLLSDINAQIDDATFRWPRYNYDIHHLQWESVSYHPREFNGNTIPQEFREIPFHKLYIPRQLHNLIHRITLPPEMPSLDAMTKRVEAYRTAKNLFETASRSIRIEEMQQQARPYDGKNVIVNRRVVDRDVLIDRYQEFTDKYRNQLSETSVKDLDGLIDMRMLDLAAPIPTVAARLDHATLVSSRKKAIRPKLRVADIPSDAYLDPRRIAA